ncbi:cytochrome c oxidase subunit 4 [Isoptericola sp. b441]|uniref:Cytochrome c oxidase polypeptide 4 n=1 Tax=Actinotalea lenta TaxID=3064654 RepID=A0ABT9DCQ2_9CELL|nr:MULTISPECIES: cytochrome c oxidase subunit 4 [unclassified Isoptericola]MDO8107963.1 cytochrome c oxidase subunit 4 [Isoptericola sp. b441]MDO8120370.1 cytochrome c oxidase subunit 4 [Isoptericola sp. b490]
MKASSRVLAILTGFLLVVGVVYGVWSHGEAVGMGALLLSAGLTGMLTFYMLVVDRRSGGMPEDDPQAEISDGAGDLGTFSPWSWWPLVVGAGAAIGFLALAVGWWLLVPGVIVAFLGLVGWIFEFSRGQHAH